MWSAWPKYVCTVVLQSHWHTVTYLQLFLNGSVMADPHLIQTVSCWMNDPKRLKLCDNVLFFNIVNLGWPSNCKHLGPVKPHVAYSSQWHSAPCDLLTFCLSNEFWGFPQRLLICSNILLRERVRPLNCLLECLTGRTDLFTLVYLIVQRFCK